MKTDLHLVRRYAILLLRHLRQAANQWICDRRGIILKGPSIKTAIGSDMAEAVQESIEQTFGKTEPQGRQTVDKPIKEKLDLWL